MDVLHQVAGVEQVCCVMRWRNDRRRRSNSRNFCTSDANTWEPKENLTGCEELLRRFEDEWSAKEASATSRRSSSEETVMLRKGKLRLDLSRQSAF